MPVGVLRSRQCPDHGVPAQSFLNLGILAYISRIVIINMKGCAITGLYSATVTPASKAQTANVRQSGAGSLSCSRTRAAATLWAAGKCARTRRRLGFGVVRAGVINKETSRSAEYEI